MNIEETKAAILVMQAYVDGAEIEERHAEYPGGGLWSEWENLIEGDGWCFNCENQNRIKPKPREFLINPDNSILAKGSAKIEDYIRVREIL